MKELTYSIYTLSDVEGNIFYVGATMGVAEKRLKDHISEALRDMGSNKSKNEIIRSLNYQVKVTCTEQVNSKEEMRKKEKQWIDSFSRLGHKLCNKHSKTFDLSKLKEENVHTTKDGHIQINAKQYAEAVDVSHASITKKLKANASLPYAKSIEKFGNTWLIILEKNL